MATNVEGLSNSILFWRSFTHLVGGMGVLVFTLAISTNRDKDNIYLMKAEVPGPIFGKIVSRLGDTARILYIMYLVMTLVLTLILWACGMPFFDMLHAFGTAGTGGFRIKNTSVAYYQSPLIEYVLGVGMIVFGVNFSLYYLILLRKVKDFFSNEELRWYLGIFSGAVILITINTYFQFHELNLPTAFRDAFFTVSSLMTTTGYSTVDFDTWPLLSKIILLLLMFVGGCAGSTAGGSKVTRVAMAVKSGFAEIKKAKNPSRVVQVEMDNHVIPDSQIRALGNYYFLYGGAFVLLHLIVSIHAPNFDSAFSAVAATFNNIGPGLGIVGPNQSYASLSDLSKISLSFEMFAGRLEILPMLVLLNPNNWKKV